MLVPASHVIWLTEKVKETFLLSRVANGSKVAQLAPLPSLSVDFLVPQGERKKYYTMPPQLLFDDEKLAYILSYVNNAWGNKKPDHEGRSGQSNELPLDVFTPKHCSKNSCSIKNMARKMALSPHF